MKNHRISAAAISPPPTKTNQRTFTPALQAMTTKIIMYTTQVPMSPQMAAMRPSMNTVKPPIRMTEGIELMSIPRSLMRQMSRDSSRIKGSLSISLG